MFEIRKPLELNPLQNENQTYYFHFQLRGSPHFFKAEIQNFGESALSFHTPEKIFKTQRRGSTRFRIPVGHLLKIEFNDPYRGQKRLSFNIHDMSATGLSFCVNSGKEVLYPAGMILSEMTLTLNGQTIQFDGEVCHQSRVFAGVRKDQIKIGVRLINIKPADLNDLTAYVEEKNQLFYLRFL